MSAYGFRYDPTGRCLDCNGVGGCHALDCPGMSDDWTLHIGRSWTGHPLEDDCPCEKAACGLVDDRGVDPNCPQHTLIAAKTMRQMHLAKNCPVPVPSSRRTRCATGGSGSDGD